MSDQQKVGFLEEDAGVRSSSRLAMLAVVTVFLGCYIFSQINQSPMPTLSWEHVAVLLVAMGIKDVKEILQTIKR